MNIVIRTDASVQIGSGHVMRCLTLADELRKKGAEVAFICRVLPGDMCDFIADMGYLVYRIPCTERGSRLSENIAFQGGKNNQKEDAECSIRFLTKTFAWLIVDHYELDIVWERAMRNFVRKIMVIDDLADRKHDCDILLDQNYYSNGTKRYINLVPEKCLKLLSPKYALIRPEFFQVSKNDPQLRSQSVNRIFVFFGGADLSGETVKALKAVRLINQPEIAIDVVLGMSNMHVDEINTISKQLPQVTLHHQVSNMAELMSHADLALGAGGTTSWERAALGVPSIVLGIADNQRKIIEDMSRDGLIIGFSEAELVSVDDLARALGFVINQPELRQFLTLQAHKLVDSKGVERVTNTLLSCNVKLRLAKQGDSKNIFNWRNSLVVRESSHNTSYISSSEHGQWLTKTIADDNKILLIGEYNGKAVGVLRYDLTGVLALISIYLVPKMHGMGFGMSLLMAGEQWLKQYQPQVSSIEAEVRQSNKASVALFNKANYIPSPTHFQKIIK